MAGERPTAEPREPVADPIARRQPPAIRLEPEHRLGLWLGGLVLVSLALAVAGFLLGRDRTRAADAPTGVAVAGPLALRFSADDW